MGEISASETAVTVSDASRLPEPPFLLTLGIENPNSETVLVTSKNGNMLAITRGADGTAAMWVAGTKCARTMTARDLNDIQSNIRTINENMQGKIRVDGIVKSTAAGSISAAAEGVDYAAAEHTHTGYAPALHSHPEYTTVPVNISATMPSGDSWLGSKPYYIDVTVAGVKTTDIPEITKVLTRGDANADKLIITAWNRVSDAYVQGAGTIRFYACDSPPDVAVPLQIRVVR